MSVNKKAVWSLDDSEQPIGLFGGQDKPDNVLKLQKRVTEQELIIVDMHKMIKAINAENKEHINNMNSFKKANEVAFDLINEMWKELKTGTTKISLDSFRKMEELCS